MFLYNVNLTLYHVYRDKYKQERFSISGSLAFEVTFANIAHMQRPSIGYWVIIASYIKSIVVLFL